MLSSTQNHRRITPRDQLDKPENERIVYQLRPGSVYDRGEFKRRCCARGAQYVPDDQTQASLRRGLTEMLGEAADADQLQEFLALVDAAEPYFAAAAEVLDLTRAGAPMDVVLAASRAARMPDGMVERFEHLQSLVMRGFPPFAAKLADREFWKQIAPIEAFRMTVSAVENADFKIARAQDGVTEETLLRVPDDHLREVGFAAIDLMFLSGSEEKNSASPSPGNSTHKSSRTAKTGRKTTRRPRAKAGA